MPLLEKLLDLNIHKLTVFIYKYLLSTMGVSKESISKFLGNRFHVKLRILSPYSNRIFLYSIHIADQKDF